MTSYRPRPIKRRRRSKADIDDLKAVIFSTVRADAPMTCRQVFYRLVSAGVIDKTEAEYKNTVVRLLGHMRLSGELPFDWIADNTRWMRKPRTYSNLSHMLRVTKSAYRRALWNDQEAYVEVWLEKDALAGVLIDVTAEWDVPLMVTRGYLSLSFLHSAAMNIEAEDKPAYLYYLGDHDPSGLDIPRTIQERLREFAPAAEIHFERVAVNPEQIDRWDLPTRPTKKSDTRSKTFLGESVEVDAIPPQDLRALVERQIEQHVDPDQLDVTRVAERSERELLTAWADRIAAGDKP